MKIQLKHGEQEMTDVLDVKKTRLTNIMRKAQTNMMVKYPRGTKGRFLEFIVNECDNVNEVIAAVISWKEVTDHMQRVEMTKQQQGMIIKPGAGTGIIKKLQ